MHLDVMHPVLPQIAPKILDFFLTNAVVLPTFRDMVKIF
jgi:hypothetical protein